jgi:hypothetical protein
MKLVEETDDVVEAVNDFCSVHTLVAFSIHKTTNFKSSGISDDSTELVVIPYFQLLGSN